MESPPLPLLGREFGLEYQAHNALDDARACGIIACMAAEKFGGGSVKKLLKAAGLKMGRM
ncbi:MAG: hypothetical protein LBQ57_01055 [Spirochaetales bacterium]|nr:hypothetical protein [Spirochaetales bacterium]